MKLTSQEIRNAIYPGKLLNRIKKISMLWNILEDRFNDMDFKRYKIDELILRIVTVYYIYSNDFKVISKSDKGTITLVKPSTAINLKTQMDLFMERFQSDDHIFLSDLETAIEFYYKNITKKKKSNFLGKGLDSSKVNAVITESFMIAQMILRSSNIILLSEEKITRNFQFMIESTEMMEPFTTRTTNITNIKNRIKNMIGVLSDELFERDIIKYEEN